MITGSARVFALLGDPVAHSLSPAMYNAAFRLLGLDAAYVPLRCSISDVPSVMRALADAGGGGNVTVPHKAVAAAALAAPSAQVGAVGAANVFWCRDGELVGENSDVAGILAALDALDAPGDAWLVAGTGGSARAVVAAAGARGAALAVRSRDAGRAEAFARWAATLGVARVEPEACSVLINATPLGMRDGDAMPMPRHAAPHAVAALDLVYRRGRTAWVRALEAQGLRAADGREMLVAQGAMAFECWFPERKAPVDAMRGAVDAALR